MAEKTRLVIVGGVAGGASAAARARRLSEDAEIILFERGEHVSFANCGLPYHIGGAISDRERLLVQTPESLRKRFRIDVRTRTEAIAIDRERKEVAVRDRRTGARAAHRLRQAHPQPRRGADPPAYPRHRRPARAHAALHGATWTRSSSVLETSRRRRGAVIVGGGYIGLEMAEALRAARRRGDAGRAGAAGDGPGGPRDGRAAPPAAQAARRRPAAGDLGHELSPTAGAVLRRS